MSKPLSPTKINHARRELPGWDYKRHALVKTYKFGSFREAMSFMNRIAFEAEEMNHHPDWTNVYNQVTIRLNTHDAGGRVTAKDVALARRIQQISWAK